MLLIFLLWFLQYPSCWTNWEQWAILSSQGTERKPITPVINVVHSSVTFLGRNAHEIIALQRAQKMPITERGELTFGQSCIKKLQLPCRLSQKPFFSPPPSSPLPTIFTHFTGIHKYSGMERDFVKGEWPIKERNTVTRFGLKAGNLDPESNVKTNKLHVPCQQ